MATNVRTSDYVLIGGLKAYPSTLADPLYEGKKGQTGRLGTLYLTLPQRRDALNRAQALHGYGLPVVLKVGL